MKTNSLLNHRALKTTSLKNHIALKNNFIENHTNIKSEMRSFKSNENIHKKEGGSYYVVSANIASSVTL